MGEIAKHVTIFDSDTGKRIHETISYGTQNGDVWMIVYREPFMELARETTNPSILRIFMSLMTKQEFDRGIKTTKKAVADELGIERTSTWNAFKWLKEHGYIKERKVNGQTEFLLNPTVTTCGKNRKEKIKLWNSLAPKSIQI